jgi:hypothetical protein
MTVGVLVPIPRPFALTAAASTLVDAEMYVYQNLTTTPVSLYSDRACTTPATNPVLSVSGFFPRRYMASAQLLTLTLKTTAGSTIHSDDNVSGYQEADADLQTVASSGLALWSGAIYGLTLSNNVSDATNDIDIATGVAMDSTNVSIGALTTALTKRLDANWTAGTGQGMRYSGAAITNTTYHLWLCWKAAGADVDVYADPSPVAATALAHLQAETGGSSYLYMRRIGSIVRVSNAIKAFVQVGDIFRWKGAIRDVNVSNLGTTAVQYTLTVPTGLTTIEAFGSFYCNTNASRRVRIYSPQTNDDAAAEAGAGMDAITVAGGGDSDTIYATGSFRDLTNSGGALFAISDGASTVLQMWTKGWIDTRGRLAA